MPDGYLRKREFHGDKSTQSQLAAADVSKTGVLAPRNSLYSIFIQRITYVPNVVAAQAITIRDTTGTPILIALIAASVAAPYVADFGAVGYQVAQGKSVDIVPAAAGPAGVFTFEAYEKLVGVDKPQTTG